MTKRRTRSKRRAGPGRPPGGGGQAKALTRDEVDRVDKTITGTTHAERNRALFFTQLATGLRAGELAALDVGDVVDTRGQIKREFRLDKRDAKYGKAREVFLEHPKARAALLTYLRAREERLTALPRPLPLFRSERGGRLTANAVVRTFALLYGRAGVDGASSHSGRRTFADDLKRRGVHPRIIQELMGHTSLATTQRYLEATPTELRSAVRGQAF